MIELPDEKWTPYVTVIGIGELGMRVLLKLREKQREGMKLYAFVLDETQVTQHDDQISKIYVGGEDITEPEPYFDDIDPTSIVLVVADMTNNFTEKVISAIVSYAEEQRLALMAVLAVVSNDFEGQKDYIGKTRVLCITPEMMRCQCEFQPDLFKDEADVVAETITGLTDYYLLHGIIGIDYEDVRRALCRPGKMTISVGRGETWQEAFDCLLRNTKAIGMDIRETSYEPAFISFSSTRERLPLYDIIDTVSSVEPHLRDDSYCPYAATEDDSLGHEVKIFALINERIE